eukprot:m.544910 g.544910  ORF g.544910 m.544910 type:complete len:127 (+) comp22142_c0_seq17:317-697(+)
MLSEFMMLRPLCDTSRKSPGIFVPCYVAARHHIRECVTPSSCASPVLLLRASYAARCTCTLNMNNEHVLHVHFVHARSTYVHFMIECVGYTLHADNPVIVCSLEFPETLSIGVEFYLVLVTSTMSI